MKQLRKYVKDGEIEKHNIRALAAKMNVLRIYNENCNLVDLVETFERILQKWFNQELFNCSPFEAKESLLEVLTAERSGIEERFISTIRYLCRIDSLGFQSSPSQLDTRAGVNCGLLGRYF